MLVFIKLLQNRFCFLGLHLLLQIQCLFYVTSVHTKVILDSNIASRLRYSAEFDLYCLAYSSEFDYTVLHTSPVIKLPILLQSCTQ